MYRSFCRLGNTLKYSFHWVAQGIYTIPHLWRLFALTAPRITFFGGGRISLDDPYAKSARMLANLCVQNGMSIITGAGSGIMQAAGLGAQDAMPDCSKHLGIGLVDLKELLPAVYEKAFIRVQWLTERKWLMTKFSATYIFFPGGVGTQNELAEVLTLTDMNMFARKPIILFGEDYWQPLIDWMRSSGLKYGFITQPVLNIIVTVNDVESAFKVIQQTIKTGPLDGDNCAL